MKKLLGFLCLLLTVSGASVQAWTASDLDLLSEQFQQSVPGDIRVQQQGWLFYTLDDCFGSSSESCWGANPDSPYGIPLFLDSASNATQMRHDEAIVYIIRTPPAVRYFSLIPYLHSRTELDVRKTLFASVDEPLNNLKIVTAASATPGDNVFDQLTVAVMTPDLRIFYRVKAIFDRLGFPSAAVQLLSLPPRLLHLGRAPQDDSFTLLMRVAVPDDRSLFDDYINNQKPVRVFRMTPLNRVTPWPVPDQALTTPGSVAEPEGLKVPLSELVEDIKANYNNVNQLATDSVPWAPIGKVCIENFTVCGGDNYDAVYTREAVALDNDASLNDFTVIVGVNHHLLNKALYINHTISDPIKQAGVASFTDKDLAGSAAYHAGITDPGDPRHARYQALYAYAVAVNCNGLRYCLEVPQAIDPGQIGIGPDGVYDIVGRVYVDPATTVRPKVTDLILPKVLTISQ